MSAPPNLPPPSTPPPSPANPASLALGLSMITCGCASSAIGLAFMKHSSDVEVGIPIWRKWRWMFGFIFLVVNATVLDLIAYGMVPLALIAPFSGLTMVFSLLIARSGCLHSKEVLSKRQGLAAGLVVVGVTIASAFGPHVATKADSMAEIMTDFGNPAFVAFSSVTLFTVAVYLAVLHVKALRCWRPRDGSPWTTAFSAYAASVCGALSQLFMKVVSLALHSFTADGPGVLSKPTMYIALVGLLTCAPLQLYLLNATLASSPVSYAVPLYQSLLVMLTTAAGGLFFLEFNTTTVESDVVYACGGVLAITGLAILGAAASTTAKANEGVVEEFLPAASSESINAGALSSVID